MEGLGEEAFDGSGLGKRECVGEGGEGHGGVKRLGVCGEGVGRGHEPGNVG